MFSKDRLRGGKIPVRVYAARSMLVICLMLCLCGAGKSSQEQIYAITIPKLSLDLALNQLAKQTGIQFLFPFDLVESLDADAVEGRYTLNEALAILLRDSGLSSNLTGRGVITISRLKSTKGYDLGKKMHNKKTATFSKKISALLLSIFGSAMASEEVIANVSDSENAASSLEEIIVTARRREESLQEVPVAVTLFDNTSLREKRIESAIDLQQHVPSLNVTGILNRNQEYFTLRGQKETGFNLGGGPGGGPGVVAYFAEVPNAGNGPGLYLDLANVQVLKGPQGTLFGRNTTGGAILFEPQRPTEEIEGYFEGQFGDYGRRGFEGALNIPVISDTLLMRIAAQSLKREGFTKDVNTGVDYDNRNNWSARVSLMFKPSDRFENYFIFNAFEHDENGPGTILLAYNPVGFPRDFLAPTILPELQAQQLRDERHTALSVEEEDFRRTWGGINRTSYELTENLTIKNIISYTRTKGNRANDEDGTTQPLLDSLGADSGTFNPDTERWTEELQIQGNSLDEALEWQIGGYYEDTDDIGQQTFAQNQLGGFSQSHQDEGITSFETKGVFGQATLELSALSSALEGLRATAGYRYTWDDIFVGLSLTSGIEAPVPGTPCLSSIGEVFPNCLASGGAEHSGETYTFGLDYRVDDSMLLYASTRRGYKSGGFNLIISVVDTEENPFFLYDPEEVNDIEIGVKADWSIGNWGIRTNIAAFWSSYENAQVVTSLLVNGLQVGVTENAAEATIQGIEFEGTIIPAENLNLNIGYSYNSAEYDSYITPDGQDLSGLPFSYVPENKFNIGVRYDFPLGENVGKLSLSATYSWTDDVFAAFEEGVPFGTISSYKIVNLRLDWQNLFGSKFDTSIMATNLTDELYRVTNFPAYNTIGSVTSLFGEPQMVIGTIRYNF